MNWVNLLMEEIAMRLGYGGLRPPEKPRPIKVPAPEPPPPTEEKPDDRELSTSSLIELARQVPDAMRKIVQEALARRRHQREVTESIYEYELRVAATELAIYSKVQGAEEISESVWTEYLDEQVRVRAHSKHISRTYALREILEERRRNGLL